MKTFLTVLTLIMLATTSKAQVWFDLGLKGGVGAGFLINKTINNDGRFGVAPGLNYFYGGKAGVHFGDFIGVTFDVDYGTNSYSFTQSEVPGLPVDQGFKYSIKHSALTLTPAIRYTKEASYLEIGPSFSFVKNPSIDDKAYPTLSAGQAGRVNTNLTGLVFGFGGHMIGNEIISLMMGLRFQYSFSNLVSESETNTNFPFSNYPTLAETGSLNPVKVQLVMEINYSLGYFVTASCGRRTAFLTF